MEKEKNCYNCVFCEAAIDIPTPSGFMCQKQDDRWFPGGIPDKQICERHRFETGITIREKIGEESVHGLWILQKAKGLSRELFDMFLEKDSAWLEAD